MAINILINTVFNRPSSIYMMIINKNSSLFYGKHFTLTRTMNFPHLNCPQIVTVSCKYKVRVCSTLTVPLFCFIQCDLEIKETTGKLLNELGKL